MFREALGEEYAVAQAGTSEGTQVKYKKGDFWYKVDRQGQEGLVEYLTARLLTFTNLDCGEYVCYEQGYVNGRAGCRSRNFLQPEEEFVTIYRLYYNMYGQNISEVIGKLETMEERISYVVRYVRQYCGVDITDYLQKVLTLDRLILNEDRHFNNLGLVLQGNRFVCAPIFDNGVSLLTANRSVNWHFPLEENVKRVIARPFSGSHERMVEYLGEGFSLDYARALAWLETEPASREAQVLRYQLMRYGRM